MKKPRLFIMSLFLFLSRLTLEVETKLGSPWMEGKAFIFPDKPIEGDLERGGALKYFNRHRDVGAK